MQNDEMPLHPHERAASLARKLGRFERRATQTQLEFTDLRRAYRSMGVSKRELPARLAMDRFLEGYTREIAYYQELAKTCAAYVERFLRQYGIRAIVTHRAKSHTKLAEKIGERHSQRVSGGKKLYATPEDVRDDIADLAGVRAALYFPGDRERIDEFIGTKLEIIERRHFPSDKSNHRRGAPIFAGYVASHYRIVWHPTFGDQGTAETSETDHMPGIVELQVGSVLMHAWAEVEHDLVYKPGVGELSREEYALLDQVNGLVLSGETALRLLQEAMANRIASNEDESFKDESELSAFLEGQVFSTTGLRQSDKISMLLIALRIVACDKPSRVRELAASIASPWRLHPVSQLVNQVLLEFPDSIGAITRTIAAYMWGRDANVSAVENEAAVQRWASHITRLFGAKGSSAKVRRWRMSTGKRAVKFERMDEIMDRALPVAGPPTPAAVRLLLRQ